MGNTILLCPECKSPKLIKFGHNKWSKGIDGTRTKKQQYQCSSCGRITVNPIVKEIPKRNDKGQFIRR